MRLLPHDSKSAGAWSDCVACIAPNIAALKCSNTAHIPPDPTACQTIPPCARCCEKGIDCLYVSERRRERRPRRRRHSPDRCSGSPDGSSSQSSQEIAISTHQPPLDLSRSIVNLSPVIECANTQAFCSSQPLANAPLSSDNSAPFTLDAPELMALSAPLIPMPQEGLGRFDGFLQLSALEHGLCSSVENPDQPHPTPQLTPELGPSFSSNSFKDDPLDQPQLHRTLPKLHSCKIIHLTFHKTQLPPGHLYYRNLRQVLLLLPQQRLRQRPTPFMPLFRSFQQANITITKLAVALIRSKPFSPTNGRGNPCV